MGDSTTVERVQQRVETEARNTLIKAAITSTRVDLVGIYLDVALGDDPLEVRDRASGQTFMLEIRALPTGG